MAEAISPTSSSSDSDDDSTSVGPIQLRIYGHCMTSYEMRRSIEGAMRWCDLHQTIENNDHHHHVYKNSLTLDTVGLTAPLTEDLIKLIRHTTHWDSIALSFAGGGDRNPATQVCSDDLLLACTTHASVRSIAWNSGDNDNTAQEQPPPTTLPTALSTMHALLYGLKYNSHLTALDATGLVLDANLSNLLSRVLVRNTTLVDLALNGTRFLTDAAAASGSNGSNNGTPHRGTRNTTVQTLSFGLRFNRTIESLSLERCHDLGDDDVACLINAINSDGTVLRKLSLKETACYDQGMASIAVMLHENVIEDLNLSYLKRRPKKQAVEPTTQPETEPDKEEEQQEDDGAENEGSDQEESGADRNKEETDEAGADLTAETTGTDDGEQKPEETRSQKDQTSDKDGEEDSQKVLNTSLKTLSMAGNFLDDDYLESLLNVFPHPTNQRSGSSASHEEDPGCSRLVELDLLGNRFSNHGIKRLLLKLPRFPYLQRLYLGYQRPPPPPPGLPRAMLSQMVATNPMLLDKTTPFRPGSLHKEFVTAVSEYPSNYRLESVSFLALTQEGRNLTNVLEHHMFLNHGGRRLLAEGFGNATASGEAARPPPPGLWPLVMERANRLYPLPPPSTFASRSNGSEIDGFHAGNVIFCLLHAPMVFENIGRG